MNAILAFVTILLASIVASRIRGRPLGPSLLEAISFAGGMALVFFGEPIPLAYTVKAMLIVLSVVVSVWASDRMARGVPRRTARSSPGGAA